MSSSGQAEIRCPYCGEATEVHLEINGEADDMVEDCTVCCRPILIHVEHDEAGNAIVSAVRESE
jgi:uncharacterized Zn finger protein